MTTTRNPTGPITARNDDTGKLSLALHRTVALGQIAAPESSSTEDFLDALARKLAEKQGGGNGNGDGGGRRIFGMHSGEWVKLLLGWVVVSLLSLATWYLSVRDGLNARPTTPEVQRTTAAAVSEHERVGDHPKVEKRLDAMEVNVRDIKESQIRQEETHKQQSDTLQEIKQSLRRRPER
jgi:hypothetical protein